MGEDSFGGSKEPIQVVYAGYKFRSKIEAKWAMTFDLMGWKWEYEPYCCQTGSGNYLPDFELFTDYENSPILVEIKPEGYTATDNDMERCHSSCLAYPNKENPEGNELLLLAFRNPIDSLEHNSLKIIYGTYLGFDDWGERHCNDMDKLERALEASSMWRYGDSVERVSPLVLTHNDKWEIAMDEYLLENNK